HITDESATKLNHVTLAPNDLLLNITGVSIGRTCLVPNHILPARVNQHVCIVRTTEILDSYFLLCFLCHPKGKANLLLFDAGGTRNALTKNAIERFLVPVPSKDDQLRITEVIRSVIGRIQSEERYLGKLELLKNGLMNDLLTGQVRVKIPKEKKGES
ncbi:MAG: restriction endonuclease subunit S, partial [Candidatus Thorarchaeota archaeon]